MNEMFAKFSDFAKKTIIIADQIAVERKQPTGSEHLLMALLAQKGTLAYEMLRQYEISNEQIELVLSLSQAKESKDQRATSTPEYRQCLTIALKIAISYHHLNVDSEHLLMALLGDPNLTSYQLIKKIGVEPETLSRQMDKLFEELAYLDDIIIEEPLIALPGQRHKGIKKKAKTPALDYFAKELVKSAKMGKIEPVFCREREIIEIFDVLARKSKNNPLLIGLPGVGKTAVIEGMAYNIAHKKVSPFFAKTKIFQVDLALMVAGTTYRGQFEERVKKLIDELENIDNAILFIDEIHTMVGTGSAEGSLDLANMLKPILTKKSFNIIGSTTEEEYRKIIEKDSALERRFQRVFIEEPNRQTTKKILSQAISYYQEFHQVSVREEVIDFTLTCCERYLTRRAFPDKALDVLDQALAQLKLKSSHKLPKTNDTQEELEKLAEQKAAAISKNNFQKAALIHKREQSLRDQIEKNKQAQKSQKPSYIADLTQEAVAAVISRWCNIPSEHILNQSTYKFKTLAKRLKSEIIAQDEAIDAICQALLASRSGVANPNRPQGSFLFLGPTGVGKTQLVKNLARELFGSEDQIIRFDMSEYMEKHSVSKLIGAPPGYVGYEEAGKLTNMVKRNPYAIILFDEIEKGHSDIFNLLLQVMEDGVLTDSQGQKVDFRQSVIAMTSNLGIKEFRMSAQLGFELDADNAPELAQIKQLKEAVLKKVREHFAPEFLNRLDHIIVFNSLSKSEIAKIVELELGKLQTRLADQGIDVEFGPAVNEFITEKSCNHEYGAREIRRAIAKYIEPVLADKILNNRKQKIFRILRKKERLVVSK